MNGDGKTTTIRISVTLRDKLKKMRRLKPDWDIETFEEVILRLAKKGGVDLDE